jgi:hypothetical protein
LADEDGAEPVVRWNSLTYQLQNQEAAARWSASSLHGKALVQGLKFDSAGNMYVTTAHWEAELQAAVRAEVMLPSNTDGLTRDGDPLLSGGARLVRVLICARPGTLSAVPNLR